jgi:tRNA G18 (ribose-2'-O)-methylase SpoU
MGKAVEHTRSGISKRVTISSCSRSDSLRFATSKVGCPCLPSTCRSSSSGDGRRRRLVPHIAEDSDSMIERIRGHHDPRVAEYRDVAEPELVKSRGLFVAEGRTVLKRVVEAARYQVRSVLVNDAAFRSLESSLTRLGQQVPVYICEAGDFPAITGHNIHRGCLALVERPMPRALNDLLAEASPRARLVVLEGVTNADNVGGVFRNAAAFRAHAVLLSPTCCDPLYRKAIRTSMGATLHVPFARFDEWPEGLKRLHAHGFGLVALTSRKPSAAIDDFVGLALLVGTEGEGLSQVVEAIADYRVRIPIAPQIDSLNLAVAAGIALHRLCDGSES